MNTDQKRLLKTHVDMVLWEQGRARARQLVKDTQDVERKATAVNWAWGDLSIEVIPENGRIERTMVSALLKVMIDEYEFPLTPKTFSRFRYCARAWPRSHRTKASWNAHMVLASHPDRFSLITDTTSISHAEELAGYRSRKAHRVSSPIECAHAAKSFTRRLAKIAPANPSEDVIGAITDAWMEMSTFVDRLGIFDELLAEYEQTNDLALA